MRRFLNLTLTAFLAVFITTMPVHAEESDEDQPRDRREHRERWRKHKQSQRGPDRERTEIPVLFRETSPHRAKKLHMMAERRPEQYRHMVRRVHRWMREMEDLKLSNWDEFDRRWEMMKMEDHIEELADRLRGTKSGKASEKIKQQLASALGELFDHKEAAQRTRIDQMEKEIKELTARVNRRHRMRSKIIERRLNELSGSDDLEF